MPETNLIAESLSLMGIGMGIVFSFLLLLVVLLRVMSWIAERLAPGFPEAPQPATGLPARGEEPGASNEEVIAVISAAIARYRARRRP